MLTLTDDKLLKFVLILGKSCVVFVWGEKLGWPRTLFIILLASALTTAPSLIPKVRFVLQCETVKYVHNESDLPKIDEKINAYFDSLTFTNLKGSDKKKIIETTFEKIENF